MAKLTLEEKRLQTLRNQLMGKPASPGRSHSSAKNQEPVKVSSFSQTSTHTQAMEINYLKVDLFKVLILTLLALGIQLSLFVSLKMN